MNTILVPLDGSEYSEKALEQAEALARLSSARLVLMTVITAYKDAHLPPVPHLDEQAAKRAADYLKPYAAKVAASGIEVNAEVRYGAPSEEIVGMAERLKADMIVMSTHGIGATGLHAIGSVAMKVLETAPCPVLMVRIPRR